MTDVSVIVPFFNAATTLARCLEGVLAQDDQAGRCEVIAVDNGSTDASQDVARRYPAARLLVEPRRSAYAARNLGLRAATGRLIAFTDADCVPRRDWLRRLTEAMTDPRVMIVMGRDRPAGRSLAVRLLGEYEHCKEAFVMSSHDPTVYYGHTNNLIARREMFDRLGPFDGRRRGADVIFVHRALELYGTEAVRYEPRALVDHLEIYSTRIYFQKFFIYGRSARRYARVVPARTLNAVERLRVFRETIRSTPLSGAEATLLFVLLTVGVGFYQLGWLSTLPGAAAATSKATAPEPHEAQP